VKRHQFSAEAERLYQKMREDEARLTTDAGRPYRIYRLSLVGRVLYDTQCTCEAAQASVRTGQIEHPSERFSIQSGNKGGPSESDPNRPYCKPDQSCCEWCCGN